MAMAYRLYGASPADFFATIKADNTLVAVPGATATVHESNGGAQVTDLQTPGDLKQISVVTADEFGNFLFLAPDTYGTLWIKPTNITGTRFYPVQPTLVGSISLDAAERATQALDGVTNLSDQVQGLAAKLPTALRIALLPTVNPTVPSVVVVGTDGAPTYVAVSSLVSTGGSGGTGGTGGTGGGTTPVVPSPVTGATFAPQSGATAGQPTKYRLMWSAPTTPGTSPVTAYVLTVDVTGLGSATFSVEATQLAYDTITFTANSIARISVQAQSAAGLGPKMGVAFQVGVLPVPAPTLNGQDAPVTTTPPASSISVQNATVVIPSSGSSSAVVQWKDPAASTVGVRLERGGQDQNQASTGSGSGFTIDLLLTDTSIAPDSSGTRKFTLTNLIVGQGYPVTLTPFTGTAGNYTFQTAVNVTFTAGQTAGSASGSYNTDGLRLTNFTTTPASATPGSTVTAKWTLTANGSVTFAEVGASVLPAGAADSGQYDFSDTSAATNVTIAAGTSRTFAATTTNLPNGTSTVIPYYRLSGKPQGVSTSYVKTWTGVSPIAVTVAAATGGGSGGGSTTPSITTTTTSSDTVRRAGELENSIGVTTHLTYSPGVYADFNKVLSCIQYVGFKKFRDGWGTGRGALATLIKNNLSDAQFCMVMDAADWGGNGSTQTGGTSAAAQLAEWQATGFIDFVELIEGPNEHDSIPTAAAQYFKERIPVFRNAGKRIGTPTMAQINPSSTHQAMGAVLKGMVDYAAFHPYPGQDSMMNDTILTTMSNNGRYFFNETNKNVPLITTENGFATSATGDQGKSMPPAGPFAHQHMRIYLESFRGLPGKSWSYRTYKYELIDQGTNSVEDTFGFFDSNYQPKPAATATRNLLSLIKDPASNALTFTPAALPGYTLSGASGNTRSVLMQKANGEWWLAVWEQVVTFATTGARQELKPAGPTVTVSWSGSKSAAVYLPTTSQAPQQSTTGTSVTLSSTYDPRLVRIV